MKKQKLFQMLKQRTHLFTKVRQQLLFAFFVLAVIPIITIGSISIRHLRKQMLEQHQSLLSAEATRIKSTIFDITTSMYLTCESVLTQQSYKDLLIEEADVEEQSSAYKNLDNELTALHDANAAISTIAVYTNNPHVPTNADIISVSDDYSSLEWYNNMISSNNSVANWCCTTSVYNTAGQEDYELTLIRRFALSSTKYSAYIVVTISNNYLKNRLLYTSHFVLSAIEDYPVFFSSQSSMLKSAFPFPEDFEGGYYSFFGSMKINGEQNLIAISTFDPYKTGSKFYILVGDDEAYQNIDSLTWNYILILIISLLIPAVLVLRFSSYFSSRVDTLRQAMHQASQGDYNIVNEFHGKDELHQTFTDLQITVNNIRENEARYYQAQIVEQQIINRQQQMEFKMLANQINPHFLYNTLEAIRMQALSNGDREVATSVKLLGKSMRYILENTGTAFTMLDKEIESIRIYFSIQKLRFQDRFQYTIIIDDGIKPERCQILPLLLQPIVENAVVHGLENVKTGGLIMVHISAPAPDLIEFMVSDNGDGMSEKKLQELESNLNCRNDQSTASGIGLYNINQRIKLMYGDSYGLQITSRLHMGTSVRVILPKNCSE